MGDAPFRTRRYLWSVKTGLARESAVGPAARRGRALEHAARLAYERYTGIQMEPLCLVHDGLEWMRASLDGLSFDGAIALEIKCPRGNRDQGALRAGRIPEHYYAQVQHQLEVSGAEELHYWSFDGRAGTLVKVHHDREYVARLLETETAFWLRVLEQRWPDDGDELNRSNDQQWRIAASRYRTASSSSIALPWKNSTPATNSETRHGETDLRLRHEVLRSLRRGRSITRDTGAAGRRSRTYRKKPVEVVRINLSPAPWRNAARRTLRSAHMNEYFGFRNLRQFEQKHREVRLPATAERRALPPSGRCAEGSSDCLLLLAAGWAICCPTARPSWAR
jgi:putative phage-type endonuclease